MADATGVDSGDRNGSRTKWSVTQTEQGGVVSWGLTRTTPSGIETSPVWFESQQQAQAACARQNEAEPRTVTATAATTAPAAVQSVPPTPTPVAISATSSTPAASTAPPTATAAISSPVVSVPLQAAASIGGAPRAAASNAAGTAPPSRPSELLGSPEDSLPLFDSAEGPSIMLFVVADLGDEHGVQRFLREGADVNVADEDGHTPLLVAARGGHLGAVRALLNAGGDTALCDVRNGFTPLHVAAKGGHQEVVSALVDRGANVNAKGSEGMQPLELAVRARSPSVVRILLDVGADVDARLLAGKAPLLHVAAMYGGSEVVSLLLENGADPRQVDRVDRTPLQIAAECSDVQTVDALLAAGADINARHHERTALHTLVCESKVGILKCLLDRGADVGATDENGRTPLHLVCFLRPNGAKRAADLLLRAGADEMAKDSYGGTARDLLEEGSHGPNKVVRAIHRLLDRAPTDKTWRRRCVVVMLHDNKMKAPAAVGGGLESPRDILESVLDLPEGVFRTIVTFL